MPKSVEFVGVPLGTDAHNEPSHFSIVAGPFVPLPTAQLSVWLTESTAYSVWFTATPLGETTVQAAPFHLKIVGGNFGSVGEPTTQPYELVTMSSPKRVMLLGRVS
jgi:hypothetical protein